MDVWTCFDHGKREPRERLYASFGLGGDQPLRYYLVRLDGQPVSVSQLFLGRDVVGLYCVGTLPEVRQQGIGTALTLVPLRDARTLGYRIGVLAPTRESLLLPALLHGSFDAAWDTMAILLPGVVGTPGFQPAFDWTLAGF